QRALALQPYSYRAVRTVIEVPEARAAQPALSLLHDDARWPDYSQRFDPFTPPEDIHDVDRTAAPAAAEAAPARHGTGPRTTTARRRRRRALVRRPAGPDDPERVHRTRFPSPRTASALGQAATERLPGGSGHPHRTRHGVRPARSAHRPRLDQAAPERAHHRPHWRRQELSGRRACSRSLSRRLLRALLPLAASGGGVCPLCRRAEALGTAQAAGARGAAGHR